MNCDLEKRGFQTYVQYVKSVHKYKFTLTRNNFTRTYWFEYPNVENPYRYHVITLDWLRDTVRDFECHEAIYEIQLSSTILQGDITHGYSYSTSRNERKDYMKTPEIKNVIFNDPATIVFWSDGTKTVVKAQNEDFDPEKGIAMAIAKKFFGNKGNYFNRIKKWVEPYEACKYWEGIFATDLSGIESRSYNIGDVIKKSAAKIASIECVIRDMFRNEKKGSE